MRELLRKLFAKESPADLSNPENVQTDLDKRLLAIVRHLRNLELSQQQIIDELHDSVERVTGETETGERAA